MTLNKKQEPRGQSMDVLAPRDHAEQNKKYFSSKELHKNTELYNRERVSRSAQNNRKALEVGMLRTNRSAGPTRKVVQEVNDTAGKKEAKGAMDEIYYEEDLEETAKKPAKSAKTAKSAKNPRLRLVSRVLAVLATVANVFFLYRLLATNILPVKYVLIAVLAIALISLFYIFKAFRKKTKKVTLIILDVFAVIISAVLLFAAAKIDQVFSFLENNIANKQYAVYDVIVNKDSKLEKLADLSGKEIITYKELVQDVSDEKLKETISNKIAGSSLKFRSDLDSVFNVVADDEDEVIIVNDGTYESYIENLPKYAEKVKIIETIEIEMDGKAVEATVSDLTKTPFILYISGIDTRTGTMPSRSLSDVNIIAVINPVTKKVQLVSIPRDSYVMIHGTTGLPDKLTHAGSRGGVALSQATLEDLYGIKIDRYVRVNFNFVEKLVDAIGGITVDSDVDTFTTLHEKCTINPGKNDLNGKCAIGFSRERYAYSDGDRHRGRNQLQVIEKIFDKMTSGTTILSKYTDILNSLNGTFDSNLSMDDITSLARMQLDTMAKWSITDYSVTGTGANKPTNSYPNQNLYVMNVDESSLKTAKQKIQAALDV